MIYTVVLDNGRVVRAAGRDLLFTGGRCYCSGLPAVLVWIPDTLRSVSTARRARISTTPPDRPNRPSG